MDAPTTQEYIDAFSRLRNELSPHSLKMLKTHFHAPEHILTATEMAREMGYTHYGGANLQYGKLGGMLCEELNLRPKYKISSLVTFEKPGPREEWRLKMRPEVVQALRILQWF